MKKPDKQLFPLGKANYLLLALGVVSILAGYGVMLVDDSPYGFGRLSLVWGPILLIIGFIVPFFAIMYRSK
jgi:amino acid permease